MTFEKDQMRIKIELENNLNAKEYNLVVRYEDQLGLFVEESLLFEIPYIEALEFKSQLIEVQEEAKV
jgi:hypothetical protein